MYYCLCSNTIILYMPSPKKFFTNSPNFMVKIVNHCINFTYTMYVTKFPESLLNLCCTRTKTVRLGILENVISIGKGSSLLKVSLYGGGGYVNTCTRGCMILY